MADVTDATFESLVVKRSHTVPVVVDLWAPWCGPCKTLGPILEQVVGETAGRVELAKVNVDENPSVSQAFQVQSIPAVFAVAEGRVVDSFIGAVGEQQVRAFVAKLAPPETEVDRLVAQGDEASLRQAVVLEPGHEGAVLALAELLATRGSGSGSGEGSGEEALALLSRLPETAEVRRVAALARVGDAAVTGAEDVTSELDSLLEQVKADDDARQRFVDLLEVLGPDDPRTAQYRRALTARLF
jgi:putative thioredoxin